MNDSEIIRLKLELNKKINDLLKEYPPPIGVEILCGTLAVLCLSQPERDKCYITTLSLFTEMYDKLK